MGPTFIIVSVGLGQNLGWILWRFIGILGHSSSSLWFAEPLLPSLFAEKEGSIAVSEDS